MGLPYPKKKRKVINVFIVNIKFNTIEVMIRRLQSLKGKTKLEFDQNMSDYYNQLN